MTAPTNWIQINVEEEVQVGTVTTTESGSINIVATAKAALIDGVAYPIPGDVLVGSGMCNMYVLATNSTLDDYVIGVKWHLYDPDGIQVEYVEIGPAVIVSVPKSGGTIEFTSPVGFYLTKEGTYNWQVEFFGRKNNPGFLPGSLTLSTLHSYVFEFNGTTSPVGPSDALSSMIGMMMTIMMLSMMMGMMKGMMPGDDEGDSGKKKEFENPEEPKPSLPPTAKKEAAIEKPIQQTQQPPTQQQPIQPPSPIKRRVIEEY